MNVFTDVLNRLVSGLLKLVLLLAALVFVASFMVAALVAVVGVSLWSLVTGRKPAPVVLFGRMREQSKRYTQGVWPTRSAQPAGDVVEAEIREVKDDSDAPAPSPKR